MDEDFHRFTTLLNEEKGWFKIIIPRIGRNYRDAMSRNDYLIARFAEAADAPSTDRQTGRYYKVVRGNKKKWYKTKRGVIYRAAYFRLTLNDATAHPA